MTEPNAKSKTWRCYGVVTGTKYLGEVQATTKEEAEELAGDLPTFYVSLCHQCISECDDPAINEIVVEEAE